MNGSSDIPLQHSSTPDGRPCSLISIIPTLGMSSCRGRAEAFARRLSSKLRTLGSQTDDESISQEDEPIINGSATNTWMTPHESEQTVTDLQPLRHESDSFFDFDCELESPGSPVDECEYLRLIETASNTPHNSAAESGYVCASAASSHSSTDGPYYDVPNTDYNNTGEIQSEIRNTNNSVHLNGRLSNGHANEDEHKEHLTKNGNGTISDIDNGEHTDNVERSECITALPITGPDVPNGPELSVNNKLEFQSSELSGNEVVIVQDKIISELQKQSEQISDTAASIVYNGKDEVDAASKATPVMDKVTEVLHIITNGHTEDGEEVLKIELTEIESPLSPTATDITSSQSIVDDVDQIQAAKLIDTDAKDAIKIEIAEPSSSSDSPTENKTKENTQLSGMDTTDDEEDCRPQRVRRCSSLKTGKTPPGTPGRKKIVRFADVLGLDLADVKTFLDEIPTIPKSAFEDLEIMDQEPPIQLGPKSDKLLMPLFQQPGGLPTFLDIVREKQVSLENAAVTDHINQTITGSVRVRNLDFHKSVHIRYTMDNWRSFADLQANYVENSCDGFSDKFSFVIFGNSLHIGQRLEFAVRFQCKGQQFWDSNYGANYCFQCLPSSSPVSNPIPPIVTTNHHSNHIVGMFSPTAGDAWCSSFY